MGCGASKGLQPHADEPSVAKRNLGRPAHQVNSSTQAPPALPASKALLPDGSPQLLERGEYDRWMNAHVLKHDTKKNRVVQLKAAIIFQARARLAQKVVAARQEGGCGSKLSWTPSQQDTLEEHLRRQMSREEKIADGVHLMQQRCEFIQVSELEMEDDGNCQFRALAHELYGHQRFHSHVRALVVAYLREHAEQFSIFVGDEREWQSYLRNMAQECCWGDELTLSAAADAMGVVIHVVTTEHENWLLHYGEQYAVVGASYRELFLTYLSPIHYNVINPLYE